MSVVPFPSASDRVTRPENPLETWEVPFSDAVWLGIDIVDEQGTCVVFRRLFDDTVCIACPEIDVGLALIQHLFFDVVFSEAQDNDPDIDLEGAYYFLRLLIRNKSGFREMLSESGVESFDKAFDLDRSWSNRQARVAAAGVKDSYKYERLPPEPEDDSVRYFAVEHAPELRVVE